MSNSNTNSALAASAQVIADPAVRLRLLQSREDYLACVQLQRETWGAQFTELVPLTILMVSQRIGGILAGAFDANERLVGFVFGMTGIAADGTVVHWSDMLAVRRDARDRGIGRRLKEYQRCLLRERGVNRILWTFDPLVARNAHLNLNRLGARVMEYVTDMYGETDGILQRGLGTDRLIVAWDIAGDDQLVVEQSANDDSLPIINARIDDIVGHPHPPSVRIEIPEDINRVGMIAPEQAADWRATTRAAFTECLAVGYEVRGLYRQSETGRCFYVLTLPEKLA